MKAWFRFAGMAVAVLLLAACAGATPEAPPPPLVGGPYDYPLKDPLAATIVGTPKDLQLDLRMSYDREILDLDIFPDRVVPEIFWYDDRLTLDFAWQSRPAPLIFLIAGTGSGARSTLMRYLQALFVARGFHVIAVPSPTFPNFVVSGSASRMPGRIGEDTRDLYDAMQLAYERVRDRIEVTKFYLAGYSLGAFEAAFLAELDETDKAFDFDRVLMMNPPVSLYRSIEILDSMLVDNVDGGINGVPAYFNKVFTAFSDLYKKAKHVNFTDDFLYQAYETLKPDRRNMAALIGLAFRLSANNMIFTADVMTDSGFIVPKGTTLDTETSLTPYFQAGARVSFMDYLKQLFFPYFKRRDPDLTEADLVVEADLHRIEDYLRGADKIGMMTNRDDIILAPGDLAYLQALFGPRARIYPTGGHLGNLDYRPVSAYIGNFFGN